MWLKPENFEALANIHVFDAFKNIQFTYLSAPGQREQWGSPQNPFQSRDVLLLCFTFKADFRFSLNSPKNLLPTMIYGSAPYWTPFRSFGHLQVSEPAYSLHPILPNSVCTSILTSKCKTADPNNLSRYSRSYAHPCLSNVGNTADAWERHL